MNYHICNMSFVYPNFLWAFFLLLIPIIVHLFNFRRYKTVYFSRVKYLQEVVEDSRSGVKLKHLLVLFSRILAISCLVLAFAQPFIPNKEGNQTENITSIYIDNSYSMQAEGKDGDLLNEVKNQAIEIVKSLEENERINLLTSDFKSIHQRFYSKSDVIDMIKEVNYSAKTTQLQSALRVQVDLLNNVEEEGNKRLFILSDFQKRTSTLEAWETGEIQTYFYNAVAANNSNVYIDSVWFETPVHRINSPISVHFRVRNNSDKDISDLTIRLEINGNEPGPKRISIPAQSFTDETIIFTDRTPGIKEASLNISTSQLFFDDNFYFTYTIKDDVKILIVNNKANGTSNFEQLYSVEAYYNATYTTIDALIPEDFKEKELILFQNIDNIPSGVMELMDNSLKNGVSLVLIPGKDLDRQSWNNYLSRHQLPNFTILDTNSFELSYFNSQDPLYNGVFESAPENYKFPEVFSYYPLNLTNSQNFITLFGRSERNPYLIYNNSINGKIILLSSPINSTYTNFQNHALFAATFLRIAETSSFQKPLFMTIGQMDNFPVQQIISEQNPIHLKNESNQVDVIPELINVSSSRSISFNHLEDAINQSGFYTLSDQVDFKEIIALNYDRNESDTRVYSEEEIYNQFKQIGWNNANAFDLSGEGKVEINQLKATEYWRILLILTLVFIGIEILLLKFWKR